MLLTHKTRITVSKEQEEILNKMSTECCHLYNHFLEQKLKHYEVFKKHLSYYIQQKELKDYKCEFITYDIKMETCQGLESNFKIFYKSIKKDKSHKPPGFRSSKYFFTISIRQDFEIKNNFIEIRFPRSSKKKD